MKKLLCLLFYCVLAASVFAGVNVCAEESVFARVWEPTEIRLTSNKTYKNPYRDVQIDAVFTHADGTTISLPGFWVKDNDFAVRFSPTKTGEWTYRITSNDADNTDLNDKTGKIAAGESQRNTELAKHGFVKIDGRRYAYDDGTPFFWLGDTHWGGPNCEKIDQCNYPGCSCGNMFRHIVDNRVEKGYTVYQTYFTHRYDDTAANGSPYMWKKEFTDINPKFFNDRVDPMFSYLNEKGMVIALGFGCTEQTTAIVSEEDLLPFVRYVVARYACYSICWISGQEITDEREAKMTPGKNVMQVYEALSGYAGELDGYKHPNGTHMYPIGSGDWRTRELDALQWHDFWALQSSHGQVQEKWYYEDYYKKDTKKPYVEAESNYEDTNSGRFVGYHDARITGWKAILCGCAGYTYGGSGIWKLCHKPSDGQSGLYGEAASFSYDPWYAGLDKPASFEAGYMRAFFENIDWWDLVPRFSGSQYGPFLVRQEEKLLASADDGSLFVLYFYNQDQKTGKLTQLDAGKTYHVWWFDPLTGCYIPVTDELHCPDGLYDMPEKPNGQDWALLISEKKLKNAYQTEALPAKREKTVAAPTGSVTMPVSVSAMGGINVKNKTKIEDPTKNLTDGDPATVWEPLSNRCTQTIILDFGKLMDLTYLSCTPKTGTVLPGYRIEGSQNGKTWRILANTDVEDACLDGSGAIAETLTGAYRYVKLLLLNAKDLTPEEIAAATFQTFHNKMNDGTYSVTAIADLAVYTNGESVATPEPEIVEEDEDDDPMDGKVINPLLVAIPVVVIGLIIAAPILLIKLRKNKRS